MPESVEKLYEFNVVVEENPKAQEPYRVFLTFSGDKEFYERLISVAKDDSVVLTWRTLPFFVKYLKYLQLEKNLFYLEQQSNKRSKHVQWSLEHILRIDKELLVFKSEEDAHEVQKALLFYLNLFAREEALKYQKLQNI